MGSVPGTSHLLAPPVMTPPTTAFIFSLLGLALSRPQTDLQDSIEASGMEEVELKGYKGYPRLDILDMGLEEETSGLQPRLEMFDMGSEEEGSGVEPRLEMWDMGSEEEGSGFQPRLETLDMGSEDEGSGVQPRIEMLDMGSEKEAMNEEETGSSEFRMAELFEASGDDDETLFKSFEEIYELGSGDSRSEELGSGMKEQSIELEVEAKLIDEEMEMENTMSRDVDIDVTEEIELNTETTDLTA